MFILRLAWRNLWRYPKRTFLTGLALFVTTLAMVFMLSFQIGAYDSMKEQTLKLMDGYGQFQNTRYLDSPSVRHRFSLSSSLYESLWALKEDEPSLVWAPTAEAFGLAMFQNQTLPAHIVGVQPDLQMRVSTLSKKIIKGRNLTMNDHNATIVGSVLARHLNANVGDDIQILSQDVHGSIAADSLKVVGIFDSGIKQINARLMQLPLADFQTLFAMPNEAHRLILMTQRLDQAEALTPKLKKVALEEGLSFRNWKALQPGLENAIEMDFYTGMVWYVAILIIVALILLNTILMSILEREREFGLMLSLGMTHRQLSALVSLETLLTMLLGMVLGMFGGTLLAYYFRDIGITLPGTEDVYQQFGLSPTLYPAMDGFAIAFAPVFLGVCGGLMVIYLSYKLYRLTPLSGRNVNA